MSRWVRPGGRGATLGSHTLDTTRCRRMYIYIYIYIMWGHDCCCVVPWPGTSADSRLFIPGGLASPSDHDGPAFPHVLHPRAEMETVSSVRPYIGEAAPARSRSPVCDRTCTLTVTPHSQPSGTPFHSPSSTTWPFPDNLLVCLVDALGRQTATSLTRGSPTKIFDINSWIELQEHDDPAEWTHSHPAG